MPGTYADPLLLDWSELNLSGLRAHCREQHGSPHYPRANLDLASWHARQHHQYGSRSHVHREPYVLLRDSRERRPAISQPRPLGWYTGQNDIPRDQLSAELRARLAGEPVSRLPLEYIPPCAGSGHLWLVMPGWTACPVCNATPAVLRVPDPGPHEDPLVPDHPDMVAWAVDVVRWRQLRATMKSLPEEES